MIKLKANCKKCDSFGEHEETAKDFCSHLWEDLDWDPKNPKCKGEYFKPTPLAEAIHHERMKEKSKLDRFF